LKISRKAVISGNIIEFYEYEKPIIKGFSSKAPGRSSREATDEEKKDNRLKTQQRAKKLLRRLINANTGQYNDEQGNTYTTKFLTLTFAENVQDLKLANNQFMKFIKRLNYAIYGDKKAKLKYVVAIEFQNRGAIHYHLVLFNCPYIDAGEVGKLWGKGFIKLNKVEEVDNIGSYVTKYMGKDLDTDKLQGKKCYFSSRGLLQPVEIDEKEKVEQLLTTLPSKSLVYSSNFENEYTGNINYQQYNTNRLNTEYRK
jgi:hypothetical protein